MDPTLAGVIGIIALFILLILRLHIALALATVGFLGIWVLRGFNSATILSQQLIFFGLYKYDFTVLPLFLLLGAFVLRSGFAATLYDTAHKLAYKVPGSLSIATTGAAAAFGALSGSSLASAAIFTELSLGQMLKRGYSKELACGSIAAAGGLACLIPPSSLMVVYAIFAEQSMGRCQMAGLLPGILCAMIFVSIVLLWVKRRPQAAPRIAIPQRLSSKERWQAIVSIWPLLAFILIIWGGMYSGVFTVTEAAGVGAFVSFIILVLYKLKSGHLVQLVSESLLDTAKTTGLIGLVILAALLFSRFLALSMMPFKAAAFFAAASSNRVVILAGFLLVYVFLGMFLEGIGMMAITLPVVLPVLQGLGYNLIWFGVVLVIMIEVGFLTPPVGLVVFTIKSTAGEQVTLGDVFKGTLPFQMGYLVAVVILIAFPSIALWLPSMMVY